MSNNEKLSKKVVTTVTLLAAAVIAGAMWFILGYVADVGNMFLKFLLNTVWRGWLFPNGWNIFGATPFFWFIVAVIALFIVQSRLDSKQFRLQKDEFEAKKKRSEERYNSSDRSYRYNQNQRFEFRHSTPTWLKTTAIATGVAWLIFAIVSMFMYGDWNGRYYNESSTFVVQDSDNLPNSLLRISDADHQQVTIQSGVMPDNWETRAASATGAAYVMQKTGDSNTNTELLTETVSYIYNTEGSGGSWTGIRNGKKRQPIFGVTSWAGSGQSVQTCEFKGKNKLNKAFRGHWGMNLNDDIAHAEPNFTYDMQDVYGYCDGDNPVIVIPGAKVTGNAIQVASTSYGVMVITGSVSGQPNIELHDTMKPGELPGPVYPLHLVQKQRDALSWSAGRVWMWQAPVGFEETNSSSQLGNNTDFLLKSKEDGRLYWTTPMKPRHSDSQTIVAYAMVAADEISGGQLNEQRIYVLNDDDLRIVNFNDLENTVTQAVAKVDPGFFTGGEENQGRIVEFVPTGGGSWQVFAERGGRAVYKIDINGGSRMHATVAGIDEDANLAPLPPTDTNTDTPPSKPTLECSDPAALSDGELAYCISQLSSELTQRLQNDQKK